MQKVALFALVSLVSLPLWSSAAQAQDAAPTTPAPAAAEAPKEEKAAAPVAPAEEKKSETAAEKKKPEAAAEKKPEAVDAKKDIAPATDAPATDAPATDAPATDAPATDAPATRPDAAAEDAVTTISVSSAPIGRIFLNGKDSGLDTPLVDHPIDAGTHTLKVVEMASGREKTVTFHLEAGNNLNLNLNLPEAKAAPLVATDDKDAVENPTGDADTAGPGAVGGEDDDWTWMTVAGWSGLGLGAMGLLAGTVVLTSQFSDQDGPLGFGLFGAGAGLVLGGGVLIYLDNELMSEDASDAPVAADEAEKAWVPFGNLR